MRSAAGLVRWCTTLVLLSSVAGWSHASEAQSGSRVRERGSAPSTRQSAVRAKSVPGPGERPTARDLPLDAWDSLYVRHDYFRLRDSVAAWRGPVTPGTRYLRGLLARAFNQPDRAIEWLQPVVDSMPRSLSRDQLYRSARALAESYQRVYRYREASEVYLLALQRLGPTLDSASRADLRGWARVSGALAGVLPQRVSWSRVATRDTLPNLGEEYRGLVGINDVAVAAPLGFDVAREFTVIDSSTAARHRVELLDGVVPAVAASGARTEARLGVIRSLEIGPATVSNVVALVLADSDLTTRGALAGSVAGARTGAGPAAGAAAGIAGAGTHLTGVVGFPVLNALGGVTYTRDGHVAVSSPGVARIDTVPGARMALQGVIPVLNASYGGRDIRLTVQTGADRTVLYPQFIRNFAGAVRDTATRMFRSSGTPGSRWNVPWTVPAYVLRKASFRIGGRTLQMDSVPVLTQAVGEASALYDGNLGRDALTHSDAVTLDLSGMGVSFQERPPEAVLPTISYPAEPALSQTPKTVPQEIGFIALLFALFILPKALQRYRVPGAVTSLVMGGAASAFGLFQQDPTLHLLSTLGIVALFLFAGLEIDGHELRANASALALHGVIWSVLTVVTTGLVAAVLGMSTRASALLALALVTPSTGFILSSLESFGLTASEQRSVKTYAVGSELLALAVLFFVLQSTSLQRLILAVGALAAVVLVIPIAFRIFAAIVAPYAPRSEFAFLIMVAVVSAYATRRLGVYYLVGAFLVGVAAQRFRADHPAMSSERMVNALESFGSVFIPFYFFYAGTEIVRDQLTPGALGLGLLLALIFIPVRIGTIAIHRRVALREAFASSRRVGSALLPTLVFTLVLVGILHDRFDLADQIAGALVLYTILNTTLPAFALHSRPPAFDATPDPAAAPSHV